MKIHPLSLFLLSVVAIPPALAQNAPTLEEQRQRSGMEMREERQCSGVEMQRQRQQLDQRIDSSGAPAGDATAPDRPASDVRRAPRVPRLDDPASGDPRDERPLAPDRPATTPTPVPPANGAAGGMGTGGGNGATQGGPTGGGAARP